MAKKLLNKLSENKYTFVIIILLLFIFAGYIYAVLTWESKSDPASERVIREVVAKTLNKDPNKLSSHDFSKITTFGLSEKKLSDIELIKKFTNLEKFSLSAISIPQSMNSLRIKNIPKWKKFLVKMGIIKAPEKKYLDLSPLEKLSHLQEIRLFIVPANDITPLAKLSKIRVLILNATNISDIEPLRNFTNLHELSLGVYDKTDLELLKDLKNLRKLTLSSTSEIDQQIEDLQKALPNTTIKYNKIAVIDNSW